MLTTLDPIRVGSAVGVVLGYLGLSAYCLGWFKGKAARPAELKTAHLICHASQTGTAEWLAHSAAAALTAAGQSARCLSLQQLSREDLAQCRSAFFIASTTGEGDAPDSATAFVQRIMAGGLPLPELRYAVLALGSQEYRNFCGFGRRLDDWLGNQGARAYFPRIEVSNQDAQAIQQWRQALAGITGASAETPASDDWREGVFIARQHLNPGSQGNGVYLIDLEAALPAWESGDLIDLQLDSADATPRSYSILSRPDESRVRLLIRQHRFDDGRLGLMSGWLSELAQPGDRIRLRLHPQPGFQLGANDNRPLILIGNGTGLAGLYSHLNTRASRGICNNWLIFGERNAAHDFHLRPDLEGWRDQGLLNRLDAVFSRDGGEYHYVQDFLRGNAAEIRRWVTDNKAAIYICGSRAGMAEGVDTALAEALGRVTLDLLVEQGRYQRDIY